MGWWDDVPFQSHRVEIIFDQDLAPYYGWLFPEGPNRVNIGICYEDPSVEKNARQLFQTFLDRHYRERLASARPIGSWKGHPISYDPRPTRLTSTGLTNHAVAASGQEWWARPSGKRVQSPQLASHARANMAQM
jgi:flavin-dependent dehydrogenase